MDETDRKILRSAWSAGALIAGDASAGRAVVVEVLASGTAPKRVNESQAYRAAIVIARELAGAGSSASLVAGDGSLYAAGVRERAAWLIARVFDEPIATICRATGLETPDAEAALASLDAAVPEGLASKLRAWMDAADIDAELDEAWRAAAPRRRQRKWLTVSLVMVLFVCFGLMLFVMLDLLSWDEREDELQQEAMRFSNPMPEGVERPSLRLPSEPADVEGATRER